MAAYSIAWAAQPIIEETRIVFKPSNAVVKYSPHVVSHSNPEEANRKSEPVYITEKVLDIPQWEKILIIKQGHYYEDIDVSISIYNYEGEFIKKTEPVFGGISILFMENSKRFFLCQQSGHYDLKTGYLYDMNGILKKEVDQGKPAALCETSKDNQIFWTIQNYLKKDMVPYSKVKVFNFNGEWIKSLETENQKEIKLKHGAQEYLINVPQPQIPM